MDPDNYKYQAKEDAGDKGIYKAIAGAQKYALMKVFMIPTGDDPEADEGVDERNHKAPTKPTPAPKQEKQPEKQEKQEKPMDWTAFWGRMCEVGLY